MKSRQSSQSATQGCIAKYGYLPEQYLCQDELEANQLVPFWKQLSRMAKNTRPNTTTLMPSSKKEVLIYDYVDEQIHMLQKMYKKKLLSYKAIGHEVKEKLSLS